MFKFRKSAAEKRVPVTNRRVILPLIMFVLSSCDPNQYGTLEDHFNINADKVSEMIVTKNDTETTVSDDKLIRKFFSTISSCDTNTELHKLRVYDRYEVIVTIDSINFVYKFKDKGREGLMLNINSKGRSGHIVHHAKCDEMEYLFNRIFKD